jgi:hypothetical protein
MILTILDRNALQSIGVVSKPASADEATGKAKERTEVRTLVFLFVSFFFLYFIQVDEILEKIYANMSACHLKNQNYKRAVETADKVTRTNSLRPETWANLAYGRLWLRTRRTTKPCSAKEKHWEN